MHHENEMKRGLLFHFWADIDTNPTLMGLIRSLIQGGFELDLCHETRDFFLPPSLPSRGITCFSVPTWKNCQKEVTEFIDRQREGEPYSYVIAVDPQGLFVALPHVQHLQVPLIYLSFELTFLDELRDEDDVRLKKIEIEASQLAELVIIQDEKRGQLLAQENSLALEKFVYLPNAPTDFPACQHCDYLRKELGIPAEKRIVLHAGSFDFWTFGEELFNAAHQWDDSYILVIHIRQFPRKDDLVTRLMSHCDPNKVRFSTQPIPYDRYGEVVASCDVGLVLYKITPTKFTQKNLYHIGLSSGKFSYFARHGKPVVTNHLPTYREIFNRYHNGLCVRSIESLGQTLTDLDGDLRKMGKNNRHFFEDKLDFTKNMTRVLERIRALL